VRNLARDPHATRRDAAKGRASETFSQTYNRQRRLGCPTAATGSGLELLVDEAVSTVVTNTTVSPNVSNTDFAAIPVSGTTQYLGKSLTPICMNGTPYEFFVKRGATSGFADQSDPRNPFRGWNVVFVSYCSCDVHFGDAAQDYPPHVEHRGYDNSRIVEKWAREHFVNPEEIFVTGSSAGAYGAWFNAPLREMVWPALYNDTTGGVPLLVDWVNAMLDGTPAWTNVEAMDEGLLLPDDPRPGTIPTPPFFQVRSDVKVICSGGSPSGAFVE
jgi:hypothetical protein